MYFLLLYFYLKIKKEMEVTCRILVVRVHIRLLKHHEMQLTREELIWNKE
ncbi:MAG: hypothetical protein K0R34_2342 [Herbinix sp.]|jgi:hypothetical protein|nr:hypothetical protein [Herbinix sp.]